MHHLTEVNNNYIVVIVHFSQMRIKIHLNCIEMLTLFTTHLYLQNFIYPSKFLKISFSSLLKGDADIVILDANSGKVVQNVHVNQKIRKVKTNLS